MTLSRCPFTASFVKGTLGVMGLAVVASMLLSFLREKLSEDGKADALVGVYVMSLHLCGRTFSPIRDDAIQILLDILLREGDCHCGAVTCYTGYCINLILLSPLFLRVGGGGGPIPMIGLKTIWDNLRRKFLRASLNAMYEIEPKKSPATANPRNSSSLLIIPSP